MATLIELALIALWGAVLGVHSRRLLRLALIHKGWDSKPLEGALRRVWFWLGREEFWQSVRRDSAQCLQLTLMLFALIWTLQI
jgi:hypothetical protein